MTAPLAEKYVRRAQAARNLSLLSLGLFMVMLVATTFNGSVPESVSHITVLVVKLLPLCLLIPGLIRHSTRTHVWLCFVILLYFTSYSTQLVLTEWAILPTIMSGLTVVIFVGSMFYVNWTGKARKHRTIGE